MFLQSKAEMDEFISFVENELTSNMTLTKMPLVKIRDEDENIMRCMIDRITQPYDINVNAARIESVTDYHF